MKKPRINWKTLGRFATPTVARGRKYVKEITPEEAKQLNQIVILLLDSEKAPESQRLFAYQSALVARAIALVKMASLRCELRTYWKTLFISGTNKLKSLPVYKRSGKPKRKGGWHKDQGDDGPSMWEDMSAPTDTI